MSDFLSIVSGSLERVREVPGHSYLLKNHYIVLLEIVYASTRKRTKTRTATRDNTAAFAFQDYKTLQTLMLVDFEPLKQCFKDSEWELERVIGLDSVIRDEQGNQQDMIPHRVLLVDGKLE